MSHFLSYVRPAPYTHNHTYSHRLILTYAHILVHSTHIHMQHKHMHIHICTYACTHIHRVASTTHTYVYADTYNVKKGTIEKKK